MNIPDRYLDLIPWAIATLLIAGIVHIVSVLLMPTVAPRDAFARLAEAANAGEARNGLVLLPPMAPGSEVLPFEDPAFAEGVCVYDLAKGPIRVSAPADGEDFLALSFHAGAGRIYHAITDRSAIKGKIDIVIGDARQIEALEANDDEDAPPQEVRLTAPTKRGFVLARSFAKRASDQERARNRLGSIRCESFELPKE
ncbi:DUF1254 domain-containing protein [Methylocystis sp. ATCC 49242]|uniref:DUF1254 domain-containing protein n=1 Tax=Methylocystis sp. ATCC 49242 TaxID=622637 RepID=UPI0001F871DA|nr:DUF1254 domain-containing protein [Methylocystis sp. ATCC 49242]